MLEVFRKYLRVYIDIYMKICNSLYIIRCLVYIYSNYKLFLKIIED